ncbi:CheW domain protein [Isosphaera pallida ATCC 43644]|uniref:CheW domain protein n=1 Tax=Isosphaera pallida (strain ATCC 43644 / DSM 9630 / IS1B) TaxID=575540 RepID=E8QZB8_ISOPI|nr:chemotaxis protein CheW [Isosphaera pallida]ADV64247.1 CheW domain protein [Isosphaera pallida ATCC 43644]
MSDPPSALGSIRQRERQSDQTGWDHPHESRVPLTTTSPSRPATVALARCVAGGRSLALEMTAVASVQRSSRMKRAKVPPGSGALGVLEESGGPTVPVFSLADLLCFDHSDNARLSSGSRARGRHILVLRGAEGLWAVLTDTVSRVVAVPDQALMTLPSPVFGSGTPPIKALVPTSVLRESPHALASVWRDAENRPEREESDPTPAGEADGEIDAFVPLLAPGRLRPINGVIRSLVKTGQGWNDAFDEEGLLPARIGPARATVADAPILGGGHSKRVLFFPIEEFQADGRSDASSGVIVSVSQVIAVLDDAPMLVIPLAPGDAPGVIAWRQRPIPLIDLAARLGLAPSLINPARRNQLAGRALPFRRLAETRDERRSLAVVRNTLGQLFAFPTRPGIRTITLPVPCRPVGLDPHIRSDLLRGAFQWNDQLWLVPDLDRIR